MDCRQFKIFASSLRAGINTDINVWGLNAGGMLQTGNDFQNRKASTII